MSKHKKYGKGYSDIINKLIDYDVISGSKQLKGEKHVLELNFSNKSILPINISSTTGPGT